MSAIDDFSEKNNALAVGEERYQSYSHCLPNTEIMREMLGPDFKVINTINGWIIKRLR